MTETFDQNLDRLAELADNWDSYGARPVTGDAIAVARSIRATANNDGGLTIHISGTVEIELCREGGVKALLWERN